MSNIQDRLQEIDKVLKSPTENPYQAFLLSYGINGIGYTLSQIGNINNLPFLNTSKETDFSSAFDDCTSLTKVPNWDTSNGTNFSNVFADCTSLTQVPNWDTSNGTNFFGVFENCTSLTQVPDWDTSNGTNFDSVFYGCTSLTQVPNWNTSKVTNFSNAFYHCTSLTQIPNWDTSSGIDFSYVFGYCRSLTQVPNWDFSKGTNFAGCFCGAGLIGDIELNIPNCTEFSACFRENDKITSLTLTTGENFPMTYDDIDSPELISLTFKGKGLPNGIWLPFAETYKLKNCIVEEGGTIGGKYFGTGSAPYGYSYVEHIQVPPNSISSYLVSFFAPWIKMDSVRNIIAGLKKVEEEQFLEFPKAIVDQLTDTELNEIRNKGWTLMTHEEVG